MSNKKKKQFTQKVLDYQDQEPFGRVVQVGFSLQGSRWTNEFSRVQFEQI